MFPLPKNVGHVIVAPLNWGLGHATRCIPIIQELLNKEIQVTLASDGEALKVLEESFPSLNSFTLPSYKVRYDGKGFISMLFQNIPNFISAVRLERKAIKKIVKKTQPDLIISDCRFGLKHPEVTSYIISHQLNIQFDNFVLKAVLNRVNEKLINGFDMCVVPDFEDHRLSGELSINKRIKRKAFIGPLSRLKKSPKTEQIYLSIILSGPEPSRSEFEKEILKRTSFIKKPLVLVRGTTQTTLKKEKIQNVKIIDRAGSDEIAQLLLNSKYIISRAGYSSIMDYYKLKVNAFIVPTPYQTEQQYLAKHLNGKYNFTSLKQENLIDLKAYLSGQIHLK